MTRDELKKCMRKIEIAYPNKNFKVTQELFDIWYECIGDFNYSTLDHAVMSLINKNIFPPNIAEIRMEYEQIEEKNESMLAETKRIFADALTYSDIVFDNKEKADLWHKFCERLKKYPYESRMKKVYEFRENVIGLDIDVPFPSVERYIDEL